MSSELFFSFIFSCSIFASVFGLIFCITIILTVALNYPCRTPANLFTCNTAVSSTIFLVNNVIVSIYGFREDWARNQPLCIFQAFLFTISCCVISISYSLQAIGRLFATVFHKHKKLVTYRIYWPLIMLSWLSSIFVTFGTSFFPDSYIYEEESRLCKMSLRNFWASMYILGFGFFTPFVTTMVIYLIIVFYIKTNRKIIPLSSNSTNAHLPNLHRELKVAHNMMITLTVYSGGGVPFVVLWIWLHINQNSSSLDSFFLVATELIIVSAAIQMFLVYRSNKQIKETVMRHLRRKLGAIHPMHSARDQSILAPTYGHT